MSLGLVDRELQQIESPFDVHPVGGFGILLGPGGEHCRQMVDRPYSVALPQIRQQRLVEHVSLNEFPAAVPQVLFKWNAIHGQQSIGRGRPQGGKQSVPDFTGRAGDQSQLVGHAWLKTFTQEDFPGGILAQVTGKNQGPANGPPEPNCGLQLDFAGGGP